MEILRELERNLIIERVRAGLRRAKLEGRQLGRRPIEIDRPALLRDRARGLSLAQLAKRYGISANQRRKVLETVAKRSAPGSGCAQFSRHCTRHKRADTRSILNWSKTLVAC